MNDIDYNALAVEYLPIDIPNGHYKIDIKILNKNNLVFGSSSLLTVEKTQTE